MGHVMGGVGVDDKEANVLPHKSGRHLGSALGDLFGRENIYNIVTTTKRE
jgi:hypothetical protein